MQLAFGLHDTYELSAKFGFRFSPLVSLEKVENHKKQILDDRIK